MSGAVSPAGDTGQVPTPTGCHPYWDKTEMHGNKGAEEVTSHITSVAGDAGLLRSEVREALPRGKGRKGLCSAFRRLTHSVQPVAPALAASLPGPLGNQGSSRSAWPPSSRKARSGITRRLDDLHSWAFTHTN